MTDAETDRIRSFIARHQWLVLREEGTCLGPEQHTDWTPERFATFVDASRWIFAKRMPENPHEYTLRGDAADHRVFDNAVLCIRAHGAIEYFRGLPYMMLRCGRHKFWTMGSPLCDTILINRRETSGSEPAETGDDSLFQGLAFWPGIQEALRKDQCWLVGGRRGVEEAVDVDDFEFFVDVIQRDGRKVKRTWYMEVDGHEYWAALTPKKTPAIHRARRPIG